MYLIELNIAKFEYDIHSLVKAFYPEETVKVITPETDAWKAAKYREQAEYQGSITLGERKIQISLPGGGNGRRLPEENRPDQGNIPDRSGEPGLSENAQNAEEGRKADDLKVETAVAGVEAIPIGISYLGPEYKDILKSLLYRSLCRVTGRELPWGNLIGIRPTKIAMQRLEAGESDREILDFYKEKHFVSGSKAELALDIAKRERWILSHLHYENGYSLYIGIPFCPTTCLYCSFTSFPIASFRQKVDRYIDCLIRELDFVAEVYGDKILDTVYIGGGTPTTLDPMQMDRLLTALEDRLDLSRLQEFTVEAGRADSITAEKLKVLKKHGVTRISVNPQTMQQETLDFIGRRHTVEQVYQAYRTARDLGFDNINMDLILGLPGEEEKEVADTLEKVKALAPDSLTVHSLAIKKASRLAKWIEQNDRSVLKNTDRTMAIAAAGASALGMKPYYLYRQKNMTGSFENVGYAREGKYGIYNILIMEELQTIVALGAGTITKAVFPGGRIERCDCVKEVDMYMDQIDEMIERKRRLLV
ncbi:MAG: coproporphyrinogen dehydrogenase HemZ [Lachnospiraceae bacterium]|nr:coproporphyrinogen dehydrogenase HemZ [Lachnospiraceae bacterium]